MIKNSAGAYIREEAITAVLPHLTGVHALITNSEISKLIVCTLEADDTDAVREGFMTRLAEHLSDSEQWREIFDAQIELSNARFKVKLDGMSGQ